MQEFVLKYKDGIVRIAFADLEYVEVLNKTVFFHLAGDVVYEATAALADFEEELLARPEFIKTHRSYLVNLSYVQAIGGNCTVTKNGHSIPVARQRRGQVQDAYLQFLHQAGTVAAPTEVKNGLCSKKPACPNGPWQILLVDDDPAERAYWEGILLNHGCITHLAENGGDAVKLAQKEHYDCVLLDVMIPGEDGFSICENLRMLTGAPVIFFSCLTDADKQMKGFASGGTDYITKDTPAELFWVKVKTRIMAASNYVQKKFGPLLLDLTERKALMNEKELLLTPSEFDILWHLSEHVGHIFTPEEIYDMIWGEPSMKSGQKAQMEMSRLRRKLDMAWESHCFIETVWGQGYRFVPPDH